MKDYENALRGCLFFTANRLANVLRRIENEVYDEDGISASQAYVLLLVNQYPEITISELSEKLDVAPSTCTRFVNALVKVGLLSKKQEWKHVHVGLTKEGQAKAVSIEIGLKRLCERCATVMTEEEYHELAATMWRVADILEKV